jgi:hypothetical protein
MPKKQTPKVDNSIKNWYKELPSSMIPKYRNPCYDDHLISIPARMIIVGASGSGKTQMALELIYRMKNTFDNITLCTMNANEPLYNFLKECIDEDQLQIYEGIEDVPKLEELDNEGQHLIIFDDLCLAKKQDIIQDYFIRSRKIANGCTVLYLTQSYFAVPKNCRLNSTHVILKKLSTVRDLKFILTDFNLDLTKEDMLKMYQDCTKDGGVLMIDVAGPPEQRFRHNFLENITDKYQNKKDDNIINGNNPRKK